MPAVRSSTFPFQIADDLVKGRMITREDLEKFRIENTCPECDGELGKEMLDLLWPIVNAYWMRQAIPGRGLYADELELFKDLKKKMEMHLMESEK